MLPIIGAIARAVATGAARSGAAKTGSSVGRSTAFRAGLAMGNTGSNDSSNQNEPRMGDILSYYPKV